MGTVHDKTEARPISDFPELITDTIPNTAVHIKLYDKLSDHWDSFLEDVKKGLEEYHSPITMRANGHYITIVGLTDQNELECLESVNGRHDQYYGMESQPNANQTLRISKEMLLARKGYNADGLEENPSVDKDAWDEYQKSTELMWLEDITLTKDNAQSYNTTLANLGDNLHYDRSLTLINGSAPVDGNTFQVFKDTATGMEQIFYPTKLSPSANILKPMPAAPIRNPKVLPADEALRVKASYDKTFTAPKKTTPAPAQNAAASEQVSEVKAADVTEDTKEVKAADKAENAPVMKAAENTPEVRAADMTDPIPEVRAADVAEDVPENKSAEAAESVESVPETKAVKASENVPEEKETKDAVPYIRYGEVIDKDNGKASFEITEMEYDVEALTHTLEATDSLEVADGLDALRAGSANYQAYRTEEAKWQIAQEEAAKARHEQKLRDQAEDFTSHWLKSNPDVDKTAPISLDDLKQETGFKNYLTAYQFLHSEDYQSELTNINGSDREILSARIWNKTKTSSLERMLVNLVSQFGNSNSPEETDSTKSLTYGIQKLQEAGFRFQLGGKELDLTKKEVLSDAVNSMEKSYNNLLGSEDFFVEPKQFYKNLLTTKSLQRKKDRYEDTDLRKEYDLLFSKPTDPETNAEKLLARGTTILSTLQETPKDLTQDNQYSSRLKHSKSAADEKKIHNRDRFREMNTLYEGFMETCQDPNTKLAFAKLAYQQMDKLSVGRMSSLFSKDMDKARTEQQQTLKSIKANIKAMEKAKKHPAQQSKAASIPSEAGEQTAPQNKAKEHVGKKLSMQELRSQTEQENAPEKSSKTTKRPKHHHRSKEKKAVDLDQAFLQ